MTTNGGVHLRALDNGVDVCGTGPHLPHINIREDRKWPKIASLDSDEGSLRLIHKDGRVEEYIRAKVFRGPIHRDYAPPSARLSSFKGWPENAAISPDKLAEAGFFYLGHGDCVRCFYCDLGLQEWNSDDDAWVEHAKHQSECFFVNLVKGEEFAQRVTSEMSGLKFSENQSKSSSPNQTPEPSVNEQASLDDSSPLQSQPQPESQPQSHESAAEVIHEVVSETSAISNQSPTDLQTPPEENSSTKTAQNVQSESQNHNQTPIDTLNSDENSQCPVPSPSSSSSSESPAASTPCSSKSSVNSSSLNVPACLICLEKDVRVFFYPCGHAVTCSECSSAVTNCIACRGKITAMLKIRYL